MKIILFPKSKSGKWAIGIAATYIILLWLKVQFHIPVISFAIAGIGLLGFVFTVIAITKYRERSVLVILSFLVGITLVLWICGEILYPH